jgi:putative inorganic carbon (hco3(-)) transporter
MLRSGAILPPQTVNYFLDSLALKNLPLIDWQQHSYVASGWVGRLQNWRSTSWFLQWGESIGALVVSAILTASPFINNNLLALFLTASIALWLILTLADDGPPGFTPIHLTVAIFWCMAVLSSALSPEKSLGLKGLRSIAFSEGISKLSLYLMFFVLMARLLRSDRIRSWVLTVYLHVALFISAYGIQQSIYGAKALATWVDPESPLSKTTRAFSYLGNPNVLAAYLLPAIALSLAAAFVWQGTAPKTLAVVMVLANIWCMYATQSRGGWIAAVVLILVMALGVFYWISPYISPFWQIWLLPISLLATMVVVGGAVTVVPILRERVSSIFVGRGDSSNSFRINVYQAVWQMIRKNPLLGIGYGDRVFKKVYPIFQINPKFSALSAYSIYLETFVEMGILGLISFVWMMFVSWLNGVLPLPSLQQSEDPQYFWLLGALAGSIGLAVQGFFDTVWYRPDINILWWLTIAVIASFYFPKLTAPKAPNLLAEAQ